jgi:LacI family transcriptional regulator
MARARRKGTGVTIQTVAEHAGVSAMTVSYVVNGTGRVSAATRESVLESVRALGYQPNVAARSLASAATCRIGIVYQNSQNAFLSAMLVGALNATSRLGAELMIGKVEGPVMADTEAAMRLLVRGGANAILLAPPYGELVSGSGLIAELGVPVAAVAHGGELPDMATIGVDDRAATRAMAERLIARGHRRIGFVTGPPSHDSSPLRLAGFRDAVVAAGLPWDETLVQPGRFTFDSGREAGEALLAQAEPPTAIFASNDDMASGVAAVAHRRRLRIPEDIAVAGFDDAPIAVKIWPSLSTVRQPVELIGERATELLVARVTGRDDFGDTRSIRMPFEVIERESTAFDR